MKKSIFMLVAMAAMVMVSCKETPYINAPGTNNENIPDSIQVLIPDTNGIEISVDSAIALCRSLPNGGETTEVYKIRGMVTANTTHPFEVPAKKRDISFTISDNGGVTGLACYYMKNENNIRFQSGKQVPLAESRVTVVGVLTKYVSASGKVTPELKDGFIVKIDSLVSCDFKGCPEPKAGELSVNDAILISDSVGAGNKATGSFKIRGVVITKEMPTPSDLQSYGNMVFTISSDGGTYATCYRLKGKNNGKFTAYNQLMIGDTVVVKVDEIQNYNGICEPAKGYVLESSNPNF